MTPFFLVISAIFIGIVGVVFVEEWRVWYSGIRSRRDDMSVYAKPYTFKEVVSIVCAHDKGTGNSGELSAADVSRFLHLLKDSVKDDQKERARMANFLVDYVFDGKG